MEVRPLPILRKGRALPCQLSGKRVDSSVEWGVLVSPAVTSSPVKRAFCQARLYASGEVHTLATLIDSGSDLNIIYIYIYI